MGKRLGEYTKNNTKCMVPVNGVPLIDRTLRQLGELNLNRIVVVTGYEGQKLKDYIESHHKGNNPREAPIPEPRARRQVRKLDGRDHGENRRREQHRQLRHQGRV